MIKIRCAHAFATTPLCGFMPLHEKSQADSCRITCCITPLNMDLFPQFCIVPTD